jgi:L-arabinose isomerase
MEKVKVGFLPLYLKLYDDRAARVRPAIEEYRDNLVAALENTGIELVKADICRIAPEFKEAVAAFEREGVDAIVTVHLAYSPSLECIDALAATKLPIIILDTTRDYSFGFDVVAGGVMPNHGIHGVQDMCNLLRRRGKDYSIFVGHYKESNVVARVADAARAVKAAKALDGMKVGQVGGSFAGMGDFLASEVAMARLGVETVVCDGDELAALRDSVTEAEIRAEYEKDCAENGAAAFTFEEYSYAERIGLAVRKWIDKNGLGAFTMTFLSAGKVGGFDTMPFSESSKAMARGTGYAGEGDVLTAALVGALSTTFDKVNFTETFCPDWKGQAIYMSHMGESNLKLLENRKTVIKPFPYADGPDPTCILGHMVEGKACLFNILPNADDWFDVVICEGEMLKLPEAIENLPTSMNGWFKPDMALEAFLEKYSELGGTHHSALVYGVDAKSLALFAKTLGMKYTII